MLVTCVVAFLLLIGTTATTNNRTGKSLIPRHLVVTVAGVLAFVVFGYTLGRDLAIHVNAGGCHASASTIEPSHQLSKANVFTTA
jgi:hypothetical protein